MRSKKLTNEKREMLNEKQEMANGENVRMYDEQIKIPEKFIEFASWKSLSIEYKKHRTRIKRIRMLIFADIFDPC
ncbi:MAG: hypothetical protein NTY07_19865 [Bacteroidia bacterium]|nr:hypothetical protein [Bacteroidia bacterium]